MILLFLKIRHAGEQLLFLIKLREYSVKRAISVKRIQLYLRFCKISQEC
jgi:hypothetical protein